MRLDKFLSNNTEHSRSDVKKFIRGKRIFVNGLPVQDVSFDIKESDKVEFNHKVVKDLGLIYFVLDKPKGYVSATKDSEHKVVTELIPSEFKHLNLKPVGRLDKDTTGLLILTNDDDFIHKMTSPKNNIEKVYIVTLADPFNKSYIHEIESGIELKDGTITKKGKCLMIDKYTCEVTITEGKYHQIKRMFGALGNKVIELRRVKFGDYKI